jgi:hypothetical protein
MDAVEQPEKKIIAVDLLPSADRRTIAFVVKCQEPIPFPTLIAAMATYIEGVKKEIESAATRAKIMKP